MPEITFAVTSDDPEVQDIEVILAIARNRPEAFGRMMRYVADRVGEKP